MNLIRLSFWTVIFFFEVFGCANAYVFINEVELNPSGDDDGAEWVELYNSGPEIMNLTGWELQNNGSTLLSDINADDFYPNEHLLIPLSGSKLRNLGDFVILVNSLSIPMDTTPDINDTVGSSKSGDLRTWQRIPDGGNEWQFVEGTPGATNGEGSGGAIPEFPSFIVPMLIVFLSIPLAGRFAGI